MPTAMDYARHIVRKCIDDRKPISNLQLQKILFFVQKNFLKRTGFVAFYEHFEAWKFGPVVPCVYRRFCGHGAMPIFYLNEPSKLDIDSESRAYVDNIVAEKRIMKPWELVAATHKPGGAWDNTRRRNGWKSTIIVEEILREAKDDE